MSENNRDELKLRSSKPKKKSTLENITSGLKKGLDSKNKNKETKKTEEKEVKNIEQKETPNPTAKSTRRKHKKKGKRSPKEIIWLIIKICLIFGVICCLGVGIYVYTIIHNAEKIDTSDINSMLSQSSYLYDDQGEIIDTTYASENRTVVSLSSVPKHVQNAFIALEDRKFETHHGINIIRMIGAVKDAILGGGEISGTSTITQQLARNVFLTEIMSERSIERKITEIYYATILEKNLSKNQILEGYLNTINFGLGYGIQTVSQTYFSKDVSELTIAEGAALATLPQAPSYYALVKRIDLEYVNLNQDHLISTDDYYGYIWNDACKDRMNYCLATMLDMGFINEQEYEEAKAMEIKDMVHPNFEVMNSYDVNYFADYVIDEVISDLMKEYDYSYSDASDMVYSGGLRIYTTLDSQAQQTVDEQVADRSYYPDITPRYDSDGNVKYYDSNDVLLYKWSNYFDEEGNFTLRNDEYTKNEDGSIRIKYKGRIAFYPVSYDGIEDVNLEFRNLYKWEDDEFYTIMGGVISIPAGYKTLEDNNDVTISAKFFEDFPEFFTNDGEGNLTTRKYTLRTQTIQPQVAITIVDNETGAIKAMCGGRETTGRSILNRATTNFQPGSSIKAFTVYGAALQNSYELSQAGKYMSAFDTETDLQDTNFYGNYITAATLFDDEPMTVNGREWPHNDGGEFEGLVSFRRGIQRSINVVAVKIVQQLGVDYPYELAKKFGIVTLDDEYDRNLSSMALGGTYSGVNTVEMASAMSTYANAGVHKSYYCYDKVTSRSGTILLEPNKEETQVLNEGVAWIMRDILQSVVSSGTATRAYISGERVGGKTGTTDIQENLWFNGFTANYTCSVHIGPDVRIPTNGWGGNISTKLFSGIMSRVERALGGSFSSRPGNVISVEVDSVTGFLPAENTVETKYEYFTSGTQPTEAYALNTEVDVCTLSGKLATEKCSYSHVVRLSGIQRPYAPSDKCLDFETELPHEYCDVCSNKTPKYVTYIDENGNAIFTKDGLRILKRTTDGAFVTIKGSTVLVYAKNPNGTIKLNSKGYPILDEEANKVEILDYTGYTFDSAKSELKKLGIIVEVTYQDTNIEADDGYVIGQSVLAGEIVSKNSTITLTVNKYVAPVEPPTPPVDPPTPPVDPPATEP